MLDLSVAGGTLVAGMSGNISLLLSRFEMSSMDLPRGLQVSSRGLKGETWMRTRGREGEGVRERKVKHEEDNC